MDSIDVKPVIVPACLHPKEQNFPRLKSIGQPRDKSPKQKAEKATKRLMNRDLVYGLKITCPDRRQNDSSQIPTNKDFNITTKKPDFLGLFLFSRRFNASEPVGQRWMVNRSTDVPRLFDNITLYVRCSRSTNQC